MKTIRIVVNCVTIHLFQSETIILLMEEAKAELQRLVDEFERNLSSISQAPESGASVDLLKRESISIEGRLSDMIQKLRACIYQDDAVSSDKREAKLESELTQLGINIEQMRATRRITVNNATAALAELRYKSAKDVRTRLFGDESKLELERAMKLKNTTASSLASDITSRLERTRDLIKSQVSMSKNAISMMKESTAALGGIGDAAHKVENVQKKAGRALWRLKLEQNWDRWLLKSALWFFALTVCYVVYRGVTRSLLVNLGKMGYDAVKNTMQNGNMRDAPGVEVPDPLKQEL